MRPMGVGKKGPVYQDDPACRWLMKLSKAALADCVIDLLRTMGQSCDEPVSEAAARERLSVVLSHRGDRPPKLKDASTNYLMKINLKTGEHTLTEISAPATFQGCQQP